MTNEILVPRKIQGKEFPTDGNPRRTDIALKELEDAKYEAQFMPTIIDARIASLIDSRIWQTGWSSQSIKATGTTRQGNKVVVYAHSQQNQLIQNTSGE